ncbi:MAG: hypothetical protein H0U49_07900 [Parachlamydiaceae bacterium]|nr:hypothetical protein [Parachlamydiaceae bacterium]
MKFNESKKFISMLYQNQQFIEDGLLLEPNPPEDVKKLLKIFNEVINAAERTNNDNQWEKFLDQYDSKIQTILDFVQMLASTTSVKKGKKIHRMKNSLKSKTAPD